MNIIAYRMPFDTQIRIFSVGEAMDLTFIHQTNGFVVHPFSPEKAGFFYPFLHKMDNIPASIVEENAQNFQFHDFNKEEYGRYINEIVNSLNGNELKKVVASRRKHINVKISPDHLFHGLCEIFPESFVYVISTKETGTWIGASPELLLGFTQGEYKSMALAGTRKKTNYKVAWDFKNIREQSIVTTHIEEILRNKGLKITHDATTTLKTGDIEHIMTMIYGSGASDINIISFLNELSPTPALAGNPRKEAMDLIKKWEGDRLYYGGFAGPIEKDGCFNLYVILRCSYLTPGQAILFAGGGITSHSDISSEWEETEKKFANILKIFS